jgi:hypothetical protein
LRELPVDQEKQMMIGDVAVRLYGAGTVLLVNYISCAGKYVMRLF